MKTWTQVETEMKTLSNSALERMSEDLKAYRQECLAQIPELEEKIRQLTMLSADAAREFGMVIKELSKRKAG